MKDLILKNFPDLFEIPQVLLVEPSGSNFELLDEFKSKGATIDCTEKNYKEYHEAMLSGNYRLVMNEEISELELEIFYKLIYYQADIKDIDIILEKTQTHAALLVLGMPAEGFQSREGLIKKDFQVDIEDNKMIAWRKF